MEDMGQTSVAPTSSLSERVLKEPDEYLKAFAKPDAHGLPFFPRSLERYILDQGYTRQDIAKLFYNACGFVLAPLSSEDNPTEDLVASNPVDAPLTGDTGKPNRTPDEITSIGNGLTSASTNEKDELPSAGPEPVVTRVAVKAPDGTYQITKLGTLNATSTNNLGKIEVQLSTSDWDQRLLIVETQSIKGTLHTIVDSDGLDASKLWHLKSASEADIQYDLSFWWETVDSAVATKFAGYASFPSQGHQSLPIEGILVDRSTAMMGGGASGGRKSPSKGNGTESQENAGATGNQGNDPQALASVVSGIRVTYYSEFHRYRAYRRYRPLIGLGAGSIAPDLRNEDPRERGMEDLLEDWEIGRRFPNRSLIEHASADRPLQLGHLGDQPPQWVDSEELEKRLAEFEAFRLWLEQQPESCQQTYAKFRRFDDDDWDQPSDEFGGKEGWGMFPSHLSRTAQGATKTQGVSTGGQGASDSNVITTTAPLALFWTLSEQDILQVYDTYMRPFTQGLFEQTSRILRSSLSKLDEFSQTIKPPTSTAINWPSIVPAVYVQAAAIVQQAGQAVEMDSMTLLYLAMLKPYVVSGLAPYLTKEYTQLVQQQQLKALLPSFAWEGFPSVIIDSAVAQVLSSSDVIPEIASEIRRIMALTEHNLKPTLGWTSSENESRGLQIQQDAESAAAAMQAETGKTLDAINKLINDGTLTLANADAVLKEKLGLVRMQENFYVPQAQPSTWLQASQSLMMMASTLAMTGVGKINTSRTAQPGRSTTSTGNVKSQVSTNPPSMVSQGSNVGARVSMVSTNASNNRNGTMVMQQQQIGFQLSPPSSLPKNFQPFSGQGVPIGGSNPSVTFDRWKNV